MRVDGGLFSDLEIRSVYTVSELTDGIGMAIEASFPGFVHVEGEISNLKESSSGHVYFTLKDDVAQIRGVFFKGHRRSDRFLPEEGSKVLAHGRIGIYKPRGEYQLVVHSLEPAGLGKFYLEFRRVRAKLESEGLLDPSRKRSLPSYPRKVAVITSRSGAVVWDFLRISGLRSPGTPVVIVPVTVQGEGASSEMIEALSVRIPLIRDLDVVVLARGGGSVEDLWPFNNELLAREILRCPVPVVSAVGHETNVTIADLVADVRVATPSEAAERIFPRTQDLMGRVVEGLRSMEWTLSHQIKLFSKGVLSNRNQLLRWPESLFDHHQYLDRVALSTSSALREKRDRELLRWERTTNRMGKSFHAFLSERSSVLRKTSVRLRSPYEIFLLRRKNWEILYQRISHGIGEHLRKQRFHLAGTDEHLSSGISSGLSLWKRQWEENRKRLMQATPFSVLEKGFAVLFHSDTRKLVSPSSLPILGERLLAHIPGYEIALEVISIQSDMKKDGN
ncbi:MAG: exodeoxyribonuclease VII large subunit [Leptospirales bacterium]